jgi:hypothetical protein
MVKDFYTLINPLIRIWSNSNKNKRILAYGYYGCIDFELND